MQLAQSKLGPEAMPSPEAGPAAQQPAAAAVEAQAAEQAAALRRQKAAARKVQGPSSLLTELILYQFLRNFIYFIAVSI